MITVVLPISRSDYLKEVFKCLSELEKPGDTELLIIIDGDKGLEKAVDKYLDTLSFHSIRIINHTSRPAETINERRYRISDIHNQAKHCVSMSSDLIFSIEDDTTYPPDTLVKLMNIFDSSPLCRFAQGVELGRHNTPYVGAWYADSKVNPTRIYSTMPDWDSQLENIDAGGLYCALIDANEYRTHHFEPYDKQGANGLGCDVRFGLTLRAKGFASYIDWSVKCGHMTGSGPIDIDNTEPVRVVFDKVNGRWKARTVSNE